MTVVLAFLLALQDEAAAQAEAAVAQFKTAYKNPDVNARVGAVAELGKTHHSRTGTVLAGLLTNDVVPVRRKAAEMLGQWPMKKAEISAILQAAVRPNLKEPLVMAALFDAMGNLRDKSAVDDVNNVLSHANDDVVLAAVRAAGKLGSAKSVDRLIGMWVTIDNYYHPHPTSDGKLESTKRTPEYDRKYGAQEPELKNAISAITRQGFGDLVAARTWWNANRATFKEQ